MSNFVPSFDERKLEKLGRQQAAWAVRSDRMHDQELKNKHDTETLALQQQTRRLREALERQEQIEHDMKLLEVNRRLGEMEKEQARQKLEREREDLRYSLECLRRDQTREWDLNDPQALAKMPKVRVDKVDANGRVIISKDLGPSSGQVFQGEDLEANERILRQYEQYKAEMERDMQERATKRALTVQEQKDYEQKQLQLIEYLKAQDKEQQALKKQQEKEIFEENQRLEAEAKERKRQEKEREIREEKEHLTNFAHTRIMQETARPGIVDEFKGFDKERVEEFNRTVEAQIRERQERQAVTLQKKVEEDVQALQVNRMLALKEQEQARARYNLARQLAEENKAMGAQQKQRRFDARYELGQNEIAPDFHEKFGKSNR